MGPSPPPLSRATCANRVAPGRHCGIGGAGTCRNGQDTHWTVQGSNTSARHNNNWDRCLTWSGEERRQGAEERRWEAPRAEPRWVHGGWRGCYRRVPALNSKVRLSLFSSPRHQRTAGFRPLPPSIKLFPSLSSSSPSQIIQLVPDAWVVQVCSNEARLCNDFLEISKMSDQRSGTSYEARSSPHAFNTWSSLGMLIII